MGTDLHACLERRGAEGWQLDQHSRISHPMIERDYLLFAIFAGVRNLWDVTPIAQPRGLPDDLSEAAVHDSYQWEIYHAHSWLTLAEIASYPWSNSLTARVLKCPLSPIELAHDSYPHTPFHWEHRAGEGMVLGPCEGTPNEVIDLTLTLRQWTHEFWFETWPSLKQARPLADHRLVFGFHS